MAEVTPRHRQPRKMQPQTWAQMQAPDLIGDTERCRSTTSCRSKPRHLIDGFAAIAPMCRCRTAATTAAPSHHPFGRGNSRSVPAVWWSEQIKRLRDRGLQRGGADRVDLTSWGADRRARRGWAIWSRILRLVLDLPRLRISSIDSIEADENLMLAIATEPRLMPHLHLSLQAGDDMILKRMKRRHLRDDAIRFCEERASCAPGIVFGADIIAGFHRNRGDVRQQPEAGRGLRPDLPACSFPYSARRARLAADAARPRPGDQGPRRQGRGRGDAALGRHLDAQLGQTRLVTDRRPAPCPGPNISPKCL